MPSAQSQSPKSPKTGRVRRTAEEARDVILWAAERRLREGGPEALRLQDIARDAGISHPTILHHFKSRDGLTKALAQRVTERLVEDLHEMVLNQPATEGSVVGVIEQVFEMFGDSGTARLLAWRALSPDAQHDDPSEGDPARDTLSALTQVVHERRVEMAAERGHPAPTFEDSGFVVRLATAATLGDSISGPIFNPDTVANRDTEIRFRRWFARLFTTHLAPGETQD